MKTQTEINLASLRQEHAVALGERESYKLLVENIKDYAIFMIDSKGYILTWNKGAQINKGYKASEIIGKHFSNFYTEADKAADKPARELKIAVKHGRVEDEGWRVKKDGSRFWANVVITPLYDTQGTLLGFAKVTRNLTERKEHEDNLRAANAVLQEQRQQLEFLNSAKDEFVSLASHQMRTPATAIKQLLGMLLEGFCGPLEAQQQEIIRKAYATNDRQIGIVNDLLQVAQIDAGKVILKKTLTDISTLLHTIIEDHTDTFHERKQNCNLKVTQSANCKILMDENNIRMALENLVDNASKYTPTGGDINLRACIKGKLVDISIKDTGVGIAPEDMNKLFQRFSRIPNSLSNQVAGNGLGLYWADKVVGLHGGRIKVDSTPNQGTTFHVMLPVA